MALWILILQMEEERLRGGKRIDHERLKATAFEPRTVRLQWPVYFAHYHTASTLAIQIV